MQAGVLGFVLVALVFACIAPHPAMLLSLGLGWSPIRSLVFGRGRRAVRRVAWRRDGTWWIGFEAELHPATSAVGPWILLVWRNPAWRRSYALIDASCVGQATFRTLRGRLRIEAGAPRSRAADENG